MMSDNMVSLTIPAESDFIPTVRLTLSGLASKLNFTIDEIEDLKVAVSEACNNVIQHAYDQSQPGVIELLFVLSGNDIEITVSDKGRGFDVQNIRSSKTDEESSEDFGLGLGLTFIKTLMDDTSFTSELGKGSKIKMKKSSSHS